MITELERRLAEFVDRRSELSAFCNMLESDEKPILLVWGDEGMGKSSLLARMMHECAQRKTPKAEVVLTETRNRDYLAIMRKIRDDIGVDFFKPFTDLVNFFTEEGYKLKIKVETTGSLSVAQGMQITQSTIGDIAAVVIKDSMITIPRSDQAVPESERMARLTDQFIENLGDATKNELLVIFFDDIQKMAEETHNWVCGELLGAVKTGRLPKIRFVVCCHKRLSLDRHMEAIVEQTELRPLQYEDIVQYLAKRGIEESHRSVLAEMLQARYNGNPLEIATSVDTFLQFRKKRNQESARSI